jgi:hypothetical protein
MPDIPPAEVAASLARYADWEWIAKNAIDGAVAGDIARDYLALAAALTAAQATIARQAAALEWALAEGGWRLWYYATEPLPPGVVRNEIGAPARWAPPPP